MTRSSARRRRSTGLSGIFAADLQVFRFYRDGTVLDVLVRPAPGPRDAEDIARWLRREDPVAGVRTAHYEMQGRRVALTTRSHLRDEDVTVRGTWVNGSLSLSSTGPGWTTGPQDFVRLDGGR